MDATATYPQVAPPAGMTGRTITVEGLIGGHSGIDIDKGRGSAHQLMARLLVEAPAHLGVRLADLIGGDTYNVIARKATAIVALPEAQADAFGSYVSDFAVTVRGELAATDPGVAVTTAPVAVPDSLMDAAAQTALLGAVYSVPQGVFRMSADVPGLVETSGNLGVLRIEAGHFTRRRAGAQRAGRGARRRGAAVRRRLRGGWNHGQSRGGPTRAGLRRRIRRWSR